MPGGASRPVALFEGWDSYFLLLGTAAAALIGLLFVVSSLPTGQERQVRLRGASLYMSPVLFHFAVVLVISAAALAPRLQAVHAAAIVGACALVGALHLGTVTWLIFSPRTSAAPHWSDPWFYGVLPTLIYAVLLAAAAAALRGTAWAAHAVAVVTLVLLLTGVRNAWDLVTWLAPSRDGPAPTAS